jgi:uncharacterized membrane protein YraQ (UPF0718 family)
MVQRHDMSTPDTKQAVRHAALMALGLVLFALQPQLAGGLGLTLAQWEPASVAGKAIAACCAPPPENISTSEHLLHAVRFFVFESTRVLLLLVLVVFGANVGRSFVTPERSRQLLLKRGHAFGVVLAALLGVVTPFCTCSAVSLFIGFVSAGLPLGVTFAFLVSAPLVNEVALVMLWGLIGWEVAALYAATGLVVAIAAGLIIGALNPRQWIERWVTDFPTVGKASVEPNGWAARVEFGWDNMRRIVGQVWVYVLCGIGAGAIIHGYVPTGFMAGIMGRDAWWAVPVAVILGVPMYSNAAGVIPIVQALLAKGAALGTALAFMMAVTALSLPEMIILRKVLKPALIALFFGIVALGILLVGYLFNAVL